MATLEFSLWPKQTPVVWASHPPGEALMTVLARCVLIVHARRDDGWCAGCGRSGPMAAYPCPGVALADWILGVRDGDV